MTSHAQQGVSLPELLIALFLASFIMVLLMRHYINAKQQYQYFQSKLEQRIDLQMVTELIRDSTRRAGFTPCLNIDHLKTRDQRNSRHALKSISIGPEQSLIINRMNEQFDTVIDILDPTHLLITDLSPIHRGQSILIADCYQAEVQNVEQVKHLPNRQLLTLNQPLAFRYQPPFYLGEWLEERFFIRKSAGSKTASLFYKLHQTEELTEEVQNMSLRLNKKTFTLLKIILGFTKGDTQTLETMVRSP